MTAVSWNGWEEGILPPPTPRAVGTLAYRRTVSRTRRTCPDRLHLDASIQGSGHAWILLLVRIVT